MSSCAWFIPPEKSAPRYNSVIGEPHAPALNPAATQPAVQPVASAAPTAENAYPPVTPETQSRADAVLANDVPPPLPEAPVVRHMPVENARQVPVENAPNAPLPQSYYTAPNVSVPQSYPAAPSMQAPNAVAQNDYPVLNAVPPSPAVADPDAAARMARVRSQLEQERNAADVDRARLQGDAAAEPSLANPQPAMQSLMPPPEPVRAAPVPAPLPTPQVIVPNNAAPLPALAPLMPRSEVPSPQRVAMAAPSVTAPRNLASASYMPPASSQAPIVLHAPVASAPVPYANPTGSASLQPPPPVSTSGFNPMAGVASADAGYPSNAYENSAYLPASRYAQQRGY